MMISDQVLRRLRALAGPQDWVVTAAQLREAGVDKNKARRIVRSGQWMRLARGSFWVSPAAGEPSLRARVRAVLLGCGPEVVAAGPTAARLLGIQGLPRDDGTVHLAVPPGHMARPRQGVRVRRVAVLAHARMVMRGIPMTNPARTCADLLLELPRVEAVSTLDSALQLGLLGHAGCDEVAAHLSGRHGAQQARDRLSLADGRAESPLETRVRLVCLDGGLPLPLLQWRIWDPQYGYTFRIDLGWPQQLVGVEADGKSPHALPQAVYKDRFRQNRLAALVPGLALFRFTWADTYSPDAILFPLRQALRR